MKNEDMLFSNIFHSHLRFRGPKRANDKYGDKSDH